MLIRKNNTSKTKMFVLVLLVAFVVFIAFFSNRQISQEEQIKNDWALVVPPLLRELQRVQVEFQKTKEKDENQNGSGEFGSLPQLSEKLNVCFKGRFVINGETGTYLDDGYVFEILLPDQQNLQEHYYYAVVKPIDINKRLPDIFIMNEKGEMWRVSNFPISNVDQQLNYEAINKYVQTLTENPVKL